MRDVARLAGVSQSTVSRVLSNSTMGVTISEATYQKVYEAVEALGYRPNLTARSLKTQRTYMIGLMIADISNPFYHTITRRVQDIAAQHQYDVMISNTDHLLEYEQRFCESMMRRPVDGIILVPYHIGNHEIDDLLRRTGTAITVLGRHIDHPGIDVVSADDETATYEAVSWLLEEKGHRRIGFIGADPGFSVSIRRQRGYQRAMDDAGITVDPKWIERGDFTHESGQHAMGRLLSLAIQPTAVVAINDIMAIGAINETLDAGLRVPQDAAIIGFDNVPAAAIMRPTLTTIAQHPLEIGRRLATALFERLDGIAVDEPRRYTIPCELIVRAST